jgi:hypothetical protein
MMIGEHLTADLTGSKGWAGKPWTRPARRSGWVWTLSTHLRSMRAAAVWQMGAFKVPPSSRLLSSRAPPPNRPVRPRV